MDTAARIVAASQSDGRSPSPGLGKSSDDITTDMSTVSVGENHRPPTAHRACHSEDIWWHVVQRVQQKDLPRLAQSCKLLYELCLPRLWSHIDTPDVFCGALPMDLTSLDAQLIKKLDKCWSQIRSVQFGKKSAANAAPAAFRGRTAQWTELCERIASLRPQSQAFVNLQSIHFEETRMHFIHPFLGIRAPRSVTFKRNWTVKTKFRLLRRFFTTLQDPERLEELYIEEDFVMPVVALHGLRSLHIEEFNCFKRSFPCGGRECKRDVGKLWQRLPEDVLKSNDQIILRAIDVVLFAATSDNKALVERRFSAWYEEFHQHMPEHSPSSLSLLAQNLQRIQAVDGWASDSTGNLYSGSLVISLLLAVGMPHLRQLTLASLPHFLMFEEDAAKYKAFAASIPSLTHLTIGHQLHTHMCSRHDGPDYPSSRLNRHALFCSMLPMLVSFTDRECWQMGPDVLGQATCSVKELNLSVVRVSGGSITSTLNVLRRHVECHFPRSNLASALGPAGRKADPVILRTCAGDGSRGQARVPLGRLQVKATSQK